MKTIRLYGALGERFGRVWRMDVKSGAEAVRALCSQLPGFRQYLQVNSAPGYRVLCDTTSRGKEELALPTSAATIRIVPVVQGAGKGLGGIIVGAALIWASNGTYGWGEAMGATMSSIVQSVGISMVLGGVSSMLTKTPKSGIESVEKAENRPSYAFDGAVNTAAQGNPVPWCYGGPIMVGSQVISAGLVTEQVAA